MTPTAAIENTATELGRGTTVQDCIVQRPQPVSWLHLIIFLLVVLKIFWHQVNGLKSIKKLFPLATRSLALKRAHLFDNHAKYLLPSCRQRR